MIERLAAPVLVARPVMRRRNVPLDMSTTDSCLVVSHLVKLGWCRTSMVYSAGTPGSLRHTRGSVPTPSHCWLIGLFSVELGALTVSHCVHTSGFSLSSLR